MSEPSRAELEAENLALRERILELNRTQERLEREIENRIEMYHDLRGENTRLRERLDQIGTLAASTPRGVDSFRAAVVFHPDSDAAKAAELLRTMPFNPKGRYR